MDRSISLKYGLMAGGSVVLYFLLFYFLDKDSIFKTWVAAVSLIPYIIFMVKAVTDQRTLQEDIISFRDAISVAFLTFIIANVVYYIFYYFLMQSNPDLVEMQKQIAIEFYEKFLSGQNTEDVRQSYEGYEINLSSVFLGFARGAIGGFILSMLIAGLMRRGKRLKP